MSGSCCGGSPKSEPTKVSTKIVPQAATEQPAENSHKSECCNDKPEKNEKRGCDC